MVPQIATVSKGLESLPERPPTPPREKQNDVDPKQLLARNSRISLHTPPNYSPDSAGSSNTGSRRTRKKVVFTVQAEYRDAPKYADKENVHKQSTPVSAPSSISSSRPIKSILKPSSSPNPPNPLDPSAGQDEATRHANIVTMLESTIKQLAGADRDSKLDAYMMLVRTLKASNNLPDRIALQDKMSLFMQFIQRDITLKRPNGNLDSSLVNHALTLLNTFLHFPAIASTLSSDFGVFIIDHCIRSFEDPAMPKDVVRHLMQVVAFQDFSPKVMSADRVGRLVASLHKIEDHLKGKSIIMSRILIYRRLIRQSRNHMAVHSDWLLDLFTDMLSSLKELRAAAIALGLEASFTIGKEKQVSRRVVEILQLTLDETKYIQYYVDRLKAMAQDKRESAAVPQVWIVVILLLRCPVDKWEYFPQWLDIIQKCFNSSDYHTKIEANYAWNRLVYALQLHQSSFSKTVGTICQPFISQLKRKGTGKQMEELRKVAIGSVCNLYYYAFKPNSSSTQTDNYWDICVRPLIPLLALPSDGKQMESHTTTSEGMKQAMLILTGLFNSSTSRLWKEERVAENGLAKPDELPALDPKWVRRNAPRVFSVVEPILTKRFLDLSRPDSTSQKLWRSLVGAVAIAASKEVKVSTDTATFIAHAFSLLLKIWTNGPAGPSTIDTQHTFLSATQTYITVMIDSLGLLPFTEKLLSMNKQNTFTPVATPSHRSGKNQGIMRTPLHHLFAILSTLPSGISDDDGLSRLIKTVLEPFILTRPSHAKRDLAQELMRLLPMDAPCPYGPWVFVSDVIFSSWENSQSSHSSAGSGSGPTVGHEYREIVRHLERGIKSTSNLPQDQWSSLFQVLVARAIGETGEAGSAISVVEPLAKSALESLSGGDDVALPSKAMMSGIELIAVARQPRDRQALDAARRRVWGTSIAGSRLGSFDPFDNFYRLTNRLLETSYIHMGDYDHGEIIVPLLTEVANFLTRCSQVLVYKSLAQLQTGIGLWIQDANAQYSRKQSSEVSNAVKSLWDRICNLFVDSGSLETIQLDALEPLLCSAFQSKHRDIVSTVTAMWNRAFEHVEEVQYPEKLQTVLVSLQPYVDIILPGLDVSSFGSSGKQPSFVESQDDTDVPSLDPLHVASAKTGQRSTPRRTRASSSRRSATPGSVQLSLPKKRRPETTPETSRPKSARRSATPRLRHDDSQIQFAPIESSSPSHHALESQLLTDRQREVRERQRENAVLFSDVRASAEKVKQKQQSPQLLPRQSDIGGASQEVRHATPEARQSFEDYVSSTPTPRRGQAPIIDDDHEMTDDVPSSPPEPRRNLLPAMQSGSRSNSVMEDYQLSSSPISGSPVPERHVVSNDPDPVAEQNTDMVHHDDDDDDDMGVVHTDVLGEDEERHDEKEPFVEEIVVQDEPTNLPTFQRQAAPPNIRLLRVEEMPKSDNEVFVDALTSPVQRAPGALRSNASKGQANETSTVAGSQPKDRSFEVSDGEEISMARLVVELDSRKCEPLPNYDTSPEKTGKTIPPALDCITVDTGSEAPRNRSKQNRSGQSSPVIPSTPADTDGSQSQSQSSGKKSKKKRKRSAENSQDSDSKKRRHHKLTEPDDVETVPDSQMPPTDHTTSSQITELLAAEMDASMEEYNDGFDSEMPSSSPQQLADQEAEAEAEETAEQGSSDVDENGAMEREAEAVNLQLLTEASQHSEMELAANETTSIATPPGSSSIPVSKPVEEAEEAVQVAQEEVARPEKSALEKIVESLRGGLEGLRTASLTREEVYKVEDMFMDIKKELYQAESRSRSRE